MEPKTRAITVATEATLMEVHKASRTPSLFHAATHHLVVKSLMGKAPRWWR